MLKRTMIEAPDSTAEFAFEPAMPAGCITWIPERLDRSVHVTDTNETDVGKYALRLVLKPFVVLVPIVPRSAELCGPPVNCRKNRELYLRPPVSLQFIATLMTLPGTGRAP